jgi:hypothetical protein
LTPAKVAGVVDPAHGFDEGNDRHLVLATADPGGQESGKKKAVGVCISAWNWAMEISQIQGIETEALAEYAGAYRCLSIMLHLS